MISADKYEEIILDFDTLHFTTSEKEYNKQVSIFSDKYNESNMFQYIEKQWLNSEFNKWQIWRNDPGFANTNSNIESFNSTIKRDFTKRWKCSLAKAIEKLFELIVYYSNDDNIVNEFKLIPAFDSKIKERALKMDSSCFKSIRKNVISYIFTLNFGPV